MPRTPRCSLAALVGVLVASCAAPSKPAPETSLAQTMAQPGPGVIKTGDVYKLTRPIPDLTSYSLVRTDAGADDPVEVSVEMAADLLATQDVIFLGEVHRHAGVHHAQMAIFRELHRRQAAISLSMEQFERDQQPVLDDYLAGKIGENTMAGRIDLWANYGTSYRPLVEFAKEHKLPVIASNAPAMVVRCVGLEGPEFLARMKPEQRNWAAAVLNLQEGAYRDKFMGFATGDAGHGGDANAKAGEKRTPSAQAVRAFAAQVTRDDTMAESIALHLQKNPGRKVVHLTGHFHSDAFLGTVERLRQRMPDLKIAVVSPLETGSENTPTISPASRTRGTLLLVIRPLPDPYATQEEMRAAIKQQVAQRRENKCEL